MASAEHSDLNAHAERLLPLLEEVFAQAKLTRHDVHRVAVGIGPGSFTGLRVGIALGQGLGLGLGIPVVGVGSLAARTGVAGGALYAAAKAGLEGLMRGLAVDYGRRGITANVVAPSLARTERLVARIAGDPDHEQKLERATASRRIPEPREIADVVTFLCSERAGAITGAVVDATAGAHLNNLW